MEHSPFTLEQYRWVLHTGMESGYDFISFSALEDHRETEQPICLLRHDCDNDLTAAAEIARIEEDLGVRSTYFLMLRTPLYNLMSAPNAELSRAV